jgi:hypothetical protein
MEIIQKLTCFEKKGFSDKFFELIFAGFCLLIQVAFLIQKFV